MSSRSVLWLLLALYCCERAFAQAYNADIKRFSIEDGLSDNYVNCIYQDQQGFLWVGTAAGLNRYNGYNFVSYNTFNTPLFSSNNIFGICQDTEGLLWVGTSDGLMILDQQGKVRKVYRPEPGNPNAISDKRVRSVYQDRQGTIWISTDNGTLEQYLGNDAFTIIYRWESEEDKEIYGNDLNYNPISHIAEDNAGNLWIKDYYGQVFRLSRPIKTLAENNNKEPKDRLWKVTQMPLKTFYIDDDRTVWGLRGMDLVYYDPLKNDFAVQGILMPGDFPPEGVLIKNRKGNFWLVNEKGFAELDPHNDSFILYNNENLYLPLRRNTIEDLTGLLWVPTSEGLVRINLKKRIFSTIPVALPSKEPFNVYGLTSDRNGDVFMHAENHLLKIDPQTSSLDTLQALDGICYELMDEDPLLWAVNSKHGLCRIDKKEIMYFKLEFGTRFHTLLRKDPNTFWIGTGAGLFSFNRKQENFRRIDIAPFLRTARVQKIIRSKTGVLWVASSIGLLKINEDEKLLQHYNVEHHKENGLRSNYLHTVYEDTQDILWLGSAGGGLIRFDPEKEQFTHYTKKDGLPVNTVKAITEHQGLLWISTNYGLSCFDPDTETFKNYFARDGLPANAFNSNSILKTNDGKIYFGSSKGAVAFSPEALADYEKEINTGYSVPLMLNRFTKFNGKEDRVTNLTHLIHRQKEIGLHYSDRDFSFHFSLADFRYPPAHEYAYMLDGLDENWHTLGKQNNISFPTLPFGRYTLRIRAKNAQGVRSEQELAIPLRMNRAFYKTPGFLIATAVFGLVLAYLFFRWRLNSLKQAKNRLEKAIAVRTWEIKQQKDEIEKQAEQLKALNLTQSRWFTNIAHELRTPLTLILGPIRQFLKTGTGIENIQLAEKNSANLLGLVNEILDISKLDSNQLKIIKKTTDLTRLIRESVSHFDSFATQKGVLLTTNICNNVDINIDKNYIQKIIINLIFNALKFTRPGGKVEISVQYEAEEGVRISVTDTGDGIPEEDLPRVFERYFQASDPERINRGGMGIGLALSLELARLHGGDLSAESKTAKGSIFTLSLPGNLIVNTEKSALIQAADEHLPAVQIIAEPANNTASEQQNKPTVLLVEDNPDMRQYIRGIMTAQYEIIEAGDGLEALERLKESTPDLIISDIMMPRMDGVSLAKALKNDDRLKIIPFISLTAKVAESDKITMLRTGIDDYLSKPFNAEELEARALNLINNYRERKAAFEGESEKIIAPTYLDQLVADMKDFVIDQFQNSAFSVSDLAEAHNMSLSSLNRFLKKATGLSSGQFIREIRLRQALKLLEAKQYPTVAEVVYAVGFENASYFTRLFSERFGKKPSEYL